MEVFNSIYNINNDGVSPSLHLPSVEALVCEQTSRPSCLVSVLVINEDVFLTSALKHLSEPLWIST